MTQNEVDQALALLCKMIANPELYKEEWEAWEQCQQEEECNK